MPSFMDDPEVVVRTRTEADRAVEDLFHGRPDEMLPVLATPPAMAGSLPPEFGMMVAMGSGKSRDENALAKAAERIGQRLGERAIYSFPAGGKRVEGPTVHLVEALAQTWGHLYYGSRIDEIKGDRVVIMAICADVVTGTVAARPAMFHLPPASGKFAEKEDQRARWESMQVQNAISKATRGVLQHALPRWYIDIAYNAADKARRTELKDKDGNILTFEQAVGQVVEVFAANGIGQAGLEQFIGNTRPFWVISDLFALRNAFRDLKAGALSREAFAVPTTATTDAPPKGQDGARAAVQRAKARTEAPVGTAPPRDEEPPHEQTALAPHLAALVAAAKYPAGVVSDYFAAQGIDLMALDEQAAKAWALKFSKDGSKRADLDGFARVGGGE